jgi:type VI secretion system protein ImpM
VSQFLHSFRPSPLPSDQGIGFFGKIPARGDFVRAGLPRDFITPWDEWLQTVLPASRTVLGETWLDAWMEAPVWRFLLAPGLCGPQSALGVFMPSVDRAGRHFPLTLARIGLVAGYGEAWLDAIENAGIAALEHDLTPEALTERMQAAESLRTKGTPVDVPPSGCLWWTHGAPRVPASRFTTPTLPNGTGFAQMLDADDAVRS